MRNVSAEADRNLDPSELVDMDSNDESAWKKVSPDLRKRAEDLIDEMIRFQKVTGFDQTKDIDILKRCRSDEEILNRMRKTEAKSVRWYEKQLNRSGIFEPIDGREAPLLLAEKNKAIELFKRQPLSGDDAFNKIKILMSLEDDLEPAREFRGKLKKQSKTIQAEYLRRLDSIGIFGSKERLLENIIKEYSEVEDQPDSVQHEFKKRTSKAEPGKTTEIIKKEVLEGYKQRFERYKKEILTNKDYFGGLDVKSQWGTLPETAVEFLEWFDERESFAEMDDAQKNLPKLIQERKTLYEKRDDVLKHATPKDRAHLIKITDGMRRHELEDYLPQLKKYVKQSNVHVAKIHGLLASARVGVISLVPTLERTLLLQRVKLETPEAQAARVKVLASDLQHRKQIASKYLALPYHLKDESKFFRSGPHEQEKMLLEAQDELNREENDAFEANELDEETPELIQKVEKGLNTESGQEALNRAKEEMKQEGLLKALKVQEETYWKIYGTANRAKTYGENQKQSYLRDLKYWTRLDQNVKDESDAVTRKEKAKFQFVEMAAEAYDMNKVMNASGVIQDKQTISYNQLETGTEKVSEKLGRAQYGEHVEIKDHENKAATNPIKLIQNLSEKKLLELVLVALNKISRNSLGLGIEGSVKLQASNSLKNKLSQDISKEFSHIGSSPDA